MASFADQAAHMVAVRKTMGSPAGRVARRESIDRVMELRLQAPDLYTNDSYKEDVEMQFRKRLLAADKNSPLYKEFKANTNAAFSA